VFFFFSSRNAFFRYCKPENPNKDVSPEAQMAITVTLSTSLYKAISVPGSPYQCYIIHCLVFFGINSWKRIEVVVSNGRMKKVIFNRWSYVTHCQVFLLLLKGRGDVSHPLILYSSSSLVMLKKGEGRLGGVKGKVSGARSLSG